MGAAVQDGCYAWAVCAATFLILVIQGGFIYSMGVFYIMFKQGLDASDSALSLVTSLNYSILFLIGPFVGILTEKYGERQLAIIGAFLAMMGIAASSFATQLYHLYLSYSLIAGIGFGIVFNPCNSILEKYFKRYIRLASSLAVCGHGIGSFIFPPIIKALEDKYGWRGALLLVAGIYSHVILFSCLYRPVITPKRQATRNTDNEEELQEMIVYAHGHNTECIPHKRGEEEVDEKLMHLKGSLTQNGSLEDKISVHHKSQLKNRKKMEINSGPSLKAGDNVLLELQSKNELKRVLFLFKSLPYTCLCLHSMLTLFPTVLVYTHFGSYILTLGFTKRDVVLLYMAMGIATTITRVILGALVEFTRASPSVMVMSSALINGVLTIMLPFTDNLTLIYVYGVLFSVMLSPYNAFCFPLTVDSVHKSQVATGYGVVCFFCVPGTAFGAPLAAWLYDYTNLYASSFYLAGGLFILSALMMIPALWQKYRKGSVLFQRRTKD